MGDPTPEEKPSVDAPPSAVPWHRRVRKPIVALVIAALGGIVTFAVREGLTMWNERRQAPMIVSIEPYEAAYDAGFQMAFAEGFDAEASSAASADDCGELHEHLVSRGGVDVGSTYLLVTLQGTTDRAVSVEGMRFEVEDSAEPITDVFVECPRPMALLSNPIIVSMGLHGLSGVVGDLDAPDEPLLAYSDGQIEGEFLADSSLTIVRGETVKLVVGANACGCNCSWRLAVDLLVDGEPQAFSLLPEQPAFRTTGDVVPETMVSWDPEGSGVEVLSGEGVGSPDSCD